MVDRERRRRSRSVKEGTEDAETLEKNDEEISFVTWSWIILPNPRKV